MSKTIRINNIYIALIASVFILLTETYAQPKSFITENRQEILFNSNWKFAIGHACDTKKDFNFNTAHFSYYAKAGYGDGPASEKFDDRAWRTIQLPHDWCVTLPFVQYGSNSHGSKAIGKKFPQNSIGWYRKNFFVSKQDTTKHFRIEFEGVYRNSQVFVNGFYVGTQESGYSSFGFDISEYLNFGGTNVIALRVDASTEEGWFYEGAGIYRNVWLIKTNKIHVLQNGTFVTAHVSNNKAVVNVQTECKNELYSSKNISIEYTILNKDGKVVAKQRMPEMPMESHKPYQVGTGFMLENPILWSLENPYLYTLTTKIFENTICIDQTSTKFGIRTIVFDKDKGFFLNGTSVKIKGVCVHQDHAGVGVAIPYELQKWRILQLKALGVNALRTSHNPPSPDLLNICDELGILVMDELRLMGVNNYHFLEIESLMKRDRNHPSVFIWSLGNEEWQIEGNEKGAKIIEKMQAFAAYYDTTRAFTVASSGGWDNGIGTKVQVMGYNYLKHGNVDEHHKKFPWQPSIGTEESNTVRTRGTYKTNDSECWLAPTNLYDGGMEGGWKFYAEREYLSGLFYWTGFDYRGEPTPYTWPAVVSQFGILDLCGFPKDNAYYLQSWWTNKPTVHIESSWNRTPGEQFDLIIYSNCKEVELVLNGKNLGKKVVEKNGHVTWPITFEPGNLVVNGYGSYFTNDNNSLIVSKTFSTTSEPYALKLTPHIKTINKTDVSIVTVEVVDKKGNVVPDANVEVEFEISKNASIIGLGNGNPSSHEPEQFLDEIVLCEITNLSEQKVIEHSYNQNLNKAFDAASWIPAFSKEPLWDMYDSSQFVLKGTFYIDSLTSTMQVTFFARSILQNQSIYINGSLLKANIQYGDTTQTFILQQSLLKQGANEYLVFGKKPQKRHQWDEFNKEPGVVQIIYPIKKITRKTFNGLAQIIIQPNTANGEILLQAKSAGLQTANLKIFINKQ